MKDAAQDVAENVAQDVPKKHGAGLCLRGPRGAHPPHHATTATAAAVFAQLALRWGRNWAAQWHLARAVGTGVLRKRLFVH